MTADPSVVDPGYASGHLDPSGRTLVEGVARVVSLSDDQALMEPEVSSGCKGCVSAGLCGAMSGQGSLAARRFTIVNDRDLKVGERVVVGVSETTLVRASWVAYAIPLFSMLIASVAADQWGGGNDGLTALAAVAGLGLGLLVARVRAGRMAERGELTPRYIRHAGADEQCHSK